MSDSDLDLYQHGGDLQPWEPNQQPLQPVADDWGSDIDYLADHQLSPSSHGLPAAANWFKKTLANPPTTMPAKHHGYPTLWQYSSDPVFVAFCNHMWQLGATPQFIECCAWWCGELEKRLDGVARNDGVMAGQLPAQGRAPSNTADDQLANLSDSDFERVQQINLQAQQRTQSNLKSRWGQAYTANMAVTQAYLSSLPAADQAYLSRYNTNWVSGLNEEKTILSLHQAAIGAGSIPKTGAGIAQEIALCERAIRENRKAWNNDPALQSRYRELLRMRDQGR